MSNLWTKLKKRNQHMAKIAKQAGLLGLSQKLSHCCDFVQTISTYNGRHSLAYRCDRCKNRVCPICNYVTSRVNQHIITTMLNYILDKHYKSGTRKYDIVFLTLTTPNVKPTVSCVSKGKHKLLYYTRRFLNSPMIRGWDTKRKSYNGVLKGALAKFEYVSKSRNKNGTINLHVHVLGLVRGSYYHSHKYYHGKQWWSNRWRDACGNHNYFIYEERGYFTDKHGNKCYLPRKVNGRTKSYTKHIAKEVGKYSGKVQWKPHYSYSDVKLEAKQLRSIYLGLKGLVTIRYYGEFSIARHLLNMGALTKYSRLSKYIYSLLVDLIYSRYINRTHSYFNHSKGHIAGNRYIKLISHMSLKDAIPVARKFARQGIIIRLAPLLKEYNGDIKQMEHDLFQNIEDIRAGKAQLVGRSLKNAIKDNEHKDTFKAISKRTDYAIGYYKSESIYYYHKDTNPDKIKAAHCYLWHLYCARKLGWKPDFKVSPKFADFAFANHQLELDRRQKQESRNTMLHLNQIKLR